MKFTVYGKPNCQHCDMSKQLLTMREKDFEYLIVGQDYDLPELQDKVFTATQTMPREFPQIFVANDDVEMYVGGFTQLRNMVNN